MSMAPTEVTVTGTLAEGVNRAIGFRAPNWLIGLPITPPPAVLVTPEEDGTFSATLAATDDPAFEPAGWAYQVTIVIDGQVQYGSLAVPAATVGQLDLATNLNTDVPADAGQVSYLLSSARGAANGVAALDSAGDVIDADGVKIIVGGGERLTSGEAVMSRDQGMSEVGLDLGSLHLSYFTATKTETINNVVTALLANVAAGNTTARIGIYSVDANGGLTGLLASTANDTALWTTGNGNRTKALQAGWSKVAGTRYAIGALVIGGSGPQLIGIFPSSSLSALAPRANGVVTGQSSLPSSVASGSIADDYRKIQFILTP